MNKEIKKVIEGELRSHIDAIKFKEKMIEDHRREIYKTETSISNLRFKMDQLAVVFEEDEILRIEKESGMSII